MERQSSSPHRVPPGTYDDVSRTPDYSTPPRSRSHNLCYDNVGYNLIACGGTSQHFSLRHPYTYGNHRYWQSPHLDEGRYGKCSVGRFPAIERRNPASSTFFSSPDPSSWLPADFVPPRMERSPANVTPTKSTKQSNFEEKKNTSLDGNMIWELADNDIVCGRGAPVNWQRGNQFFRDLITEYQTVYLCSKRCDKPKIATEVMAVIKSRGGRFVRRVKASYRGRFGWEEIHEKRAYEKVCQALREGAPELRRKMMASSSHLQRRMEPLRRDKENHTPAKTHPL